MASLPPVLERLAPRPLVAFDEEEVVESRSLETGRLDSAVPVVAVEGLPGVDVGRERLRCVGCWENGRW
jgi:hypothetical protein